MFCEKCGTANTDDSIFCSNCGHQLSSNELAAEYKTQANFDNKNRRLGIAFVVAILGVLLIFGNIFGGRSYKGAIDDFFVLYEKPTTKNILKLLPEEFIDKSIEEEFDGDKERFYEKFEYLTKILKSSLSQLEDENGNFKMTYKIKDVDDFSKKELKEINEKYEDKLEDYYMEITAAKTVKVEISIKGSDNESKDINFKLVKIKGSWYIDFFSFTNLF